jgi:hypothetical protein
MKMLLVTVALAMLLMSDALAAQSRWRGGHRSYGLWRTPGHAYALAPSHRRHGRRSLYRSRAVYTTSGFYAGQDPDPHVRSQLQRDPVDSGMAGFTRKRRR